jgi:OmcA/MtrC family decaheme c-type cytochrome
VAHPDPTGLAVTLSNIELTNTGGIPAVSFNAATATGPVTGLTLDDFRFMIATLVPAGTSTTDWGTWDTPYFERWAYERSGTDRSGNPYLHGVFDDSGAANGNYTYTFLTGFGSTEALAEAPDYNAADTQRLVITASGSNDPATGFAITNNTVGFLDFVTPAGGGPVTTLVSQRLFVTADACKKCHSEEFVEAAHADTYLDTRTCVVCHSPLGHYGDTMQEDNAYLPLLIHQIHAAIDNPAFEDQINGMGFGAVTFPQNVEKCVICHNNDSGLAEGDGNMVDNWKNHPTAEVCGSCHTDVDFASGTNHEGGAQSNEFCQVCHKPSGASFAKSITAAHDTTPTGVNVPEFDVTLTITPEPANGIYYTAGDAPEVRVTLKKHSDGSAVDPAIYTTPQDDAGHTGGGLNVASVYVYGPRAKSVPVLATGTITDAAFDGETGTPTQEHDLFVGGADPRVTTDASGFGYKLLPIPADMKAGTYMVRVRIGDYGRVGTGDYHIESIAFENRQIGTDTVETKVAGVACIDCHGTGTAPFHDERHAVVFDTDQCLACHDQSGNFAIPIANRVHAIHRANPGGDIYVINGGDPSSRDWSVVTYPRDIITCVTCHDSGDTTYKTLPYMMPCAGCHVGDLYDPDGFVITHMRQSGGPF